MTWRKSTYSGPNGGECVEVGDSGTNVLVRDTKDRDGALLALNSTAWRQLIARLKA